MLMLLQVAAQTPPLNETLGITGSLAAVVWLIVGVFRVINIVFPHVKLGKNGHEHRELLAVLGRLEQAITKLDDRLERAESTMKELSRDFVEHERETRDTLHESVRDAVSAAVNAIELAIQTRINMVGEGSRR